VGLPAVIAAIPSGLAFVSPVSNNREINRGFLKKGCEIVKFCPKSPKSHSGTGINREFGKTSQTPHEH
jgi:hypothetical protein